MMICLGEMEFHHASPAKYAMRDPHQSDAIPPITQGEIEQNRPKW